MQCRQISTPSDSLVGSHGTLCTPDHDGTVSPCPRLRYPTPFPIHRINYRTTRHNTPASNHLVGGWQQAGKLSCLVAIEFACCQAYQVDHLEGLDRPLVASSDRFRTNHSCSCRTFDRNEYIIIVGTYSIEESSAVQRSRKENLLCISQITLASRGVDVR